MCKDIFFVTYKFLNENLSLNLASVSTSYYKCAIYEKGESNNINVSGNGRFSSLI